jgi:hypothetical protein
MGDLDGGWFENGIYHLTLTFAPDFPEVLPRPKFATKMFHPQISEDGFPYLSVSMADSKVSAFHLGGWGGHPCLARLEQFLLAAMLTEAHNVRMS